MDKVLIVCGPTATGKTSLALHLAEVFDGELISADSRQVYRGMDIGTGKDIPENFEFRISNLEIKDIETGYYTDFNTRIWGYDLVDPKDEFSVAHYAEFVYPVIVDVTKRGKLPIIVGGTGLYISAIEGNIETAHIPPDYALREKYKNTSAKNLYKLVKQKEPDIAAELNNSDKNNPRRLIRILEILQTATKRKITSQSNYDLFKVGLKISRSEREKRIRKRVEDRLEAGFEDEVNLLLEQGVTWDDQSMTSLGYRQLANYRKRLGSKQETIDEWIREEVRYAKRQMTWFKRDKSIKWFDVNNTDYQKKVEELVRKWYKKEQDR